VPASPPDLVLTPALSAVLGLQLLLLLGGCAILVARVRSAPARFVGIAPNRLTPSPFRASELFLGAAFAFGGAMIFHVVFRFIADRWFPAPGDGSLGRYHAITSAGVQLGALAGLGHAWFWHLRPSKRAALDAPVDAAPAASPAAAPLPALSTATALREGFLAFTALLPIVWLVNVGWQAALARLEIPAPPQDLVLLFARSGDTASLAIMVVLAVVIAPVTEELVFRVGLFRWLRTRPLRGVALFVPAAGFAALHGYLAVFLPIVVLAVCLALAYERSGHPLVPITAHALFNLNTVVLLLAGFPV
jgi:membrane protease YdiL (CAAX protease family)